VEFDRELKVEHMKLCGRWEEQFRR
jgi:hypothetical protein